MVFRLARAELTEVFCSLGHHVLEEFHFDAAERLAAEGDIKEADRVWFRHCVFC